VHLFFLYDLPRQVWATSNPPISTHLLNPDEDGVQLSLPALITSNPTEETHSETLFLMWYIWKARKIIESRGRLGLLFRYTRLQQLIYKLICQPGRITKLILPPTNPSSQPPIPNHPILKIFSTYLILPLVFYAI
jgi:hypothetical protein